MMDRIKEQIWFMFFEVIEAKIIVGSDSNKSFVCSDYESHFAEFIDSFN